jgi:integrase
VGAVERLKPLKRTWWLVALLTGARTVSVSHLRWEDVDFDQEILHFRAAKAGRSYSVPMSRRLASILKEWREQVPPSEWVFESPVRPGRPLQGQVRDDKRGVASAHHLRHTFRAVPAQLGCPPDSARLLLGHSLSGDVSRGYITARLVVDSLRPCAESVADYYARVMRWQGS